MERVRDLLEWVGVGVGVEVVVVVVAWGILMGGGERRGGKQGRAETRVGSWKRWFLIRTDPIGRGLSRSVRCGMFFPEDCECGIRFPHE